MSYNTMAFVVDAEKIEQLWGSKSTQFVDNFINKHEGDIEDGADWFDVEPQLYHQCLRDIVNGEITQDDEYAHITGIFMKCCAVTLDSKLIALNF